MTADTQAPSVVPSLFGSRTQPWEPGMPTPNLNAALSQLQGKMPRIKKTKEGEIKGETKDGRPYSYTYKYADLGDVVADVGPILAEFGLSFHAAPTIAPGGQNMILECSLRHSSGEYLESVWPLGPVSIGPQKLGSAITYGRRYAFSAATNIVVEDDDDGQRAQQGHHTAGDAWENAKPAGNRRRPDRGQDGAADKIAQGLANAVLQIAANPKKTLDDLVKIEKQVAARDKLDALVNNPFDGGEGQVKVRDVLREARKRMGGSQDDSGGQDQEHDDGGGQETDEAAAAAAGMSDAEMAFVTQFSEELADITDPDLIGAQRAKVAPAVRDKVISAQVAGELTAACTARRRELEDAADGEAGQ